MGNTENKQSGGATEGFSRQELADITRRAIKLAEGGIVNPLWVRAYSRLADAADSLDSMIARTDATTPETPA